MPANVASRAQIRARVVGLLLKYAPRKPEPNAETPLRGTDGYGYNDVGLRALSPKLTGISQDYGGTAIGPSEVTACETQGDVIDLVWAHIPDANKR
jgi:hypothetical protein